MAEKFEEMAAASSTEVTRLRSDVEILKSQRTELEIRCSELAKSNSELRLIVEDLEDEAHRTRKVAEENTEYEDTIRRLTGEVAACEDIKL